MLRYTNYNTYSDRLPVATKSFLGGDIIAVLLRQSMRLKALQQKTRALGNVENVNNPSTFLAGIPITVIKQEAFNYQADITRFPVENGSLITDHVIIQPLRIDISFEVSNWESGTAKYAFDLFEALFRSREKVELLTSRKKFTDMVLVNFQDSNSVPLWGILNGRASFVQVGLGTLEVEKYDKNKYKQTSKTGGSSAEKSATPDITKGLVKPKTSLLKKGLNAIFGK